MGHIAWEQLNFVDYIIALIFLFSILSGISKGFVREVVSVITFFAALFIAATFCEPFARVFTSSPTTQSMVSGVASSTGMNASTPISYLALAASFALLFVGVSIIGSIIGYFMGTAVNALSVLHMGNRLPGGAFGAVKGYLWNLVLIFFLQLTPVGQQPWWSASVFVHAYQPAVQWLGGYVSPSLNQLTSHVTAVWQKVQDSAGSVTQSITNRQ